MTRPLDMRVIDRLFNRLIGIYGAQFKSKFSVVEGGVDVGVANAKETWAHELRNFGDKLEAISYALDHLPIDHAPNAVEFRDICRRAPQKEAPALPYQPTPEDIERSRGMARSLGEAVGSSKIRDGIDEHWATHPRSEAQLLAIFAAAERDQRFRRCIAQMVEDGICTAEGVLLRAYRDNQFVSVD